MKIFEKEIAIKMNNIFFKKKGIDFRDVLAKDGDVIVPAKGKIKEKIVKWWEIYSLENEEEWEAYKKHCLYCLSGREDELELWLMHYGIPQGYLFNCKQSEIVLKELRVEDSDY